MSDYPIFEKVASHEVEAKRAARKAFPEDDVEPVLIHKKDTIFTNKWLFCYEIRPVQQKGLEDF